MERTLETIINLAFDKLEKENKIKYTKAWTRDRFISAVLEKRTVDTRKFYMHFKIIVYKEDGSLLQAGAQDNRLCRYVGYKLIGKNPIKIEDIEKPIQRNRGIDYDDICNFTQSIIPIDKIYDTTDEQLLNLLIKFKEFLGTTPTMKALSYTKYMPGKSVFQTRFKTWNNALVLANIEIGNAGNNQDISKTKEQVYDEINEHKNMNVKHPICKSCGGKNERPQAEYCSELCKIEYGNRNKTKHNVENETHRAAKYSVINSNARTIQKYYEKEKSCKNCGYDKHVEVAHIKAIADFPDDSLISEINAKDNLVYLCPNCHWEFDNNLLSL